MGRGISGLYQSSIAGGIACQAFIPEPLPPKPSLKLNEKLQSRINMAMLAIGHLDAIGTLKIAVWLRYSEYHLISSQILKSIFI
jgi:hypothetical protein